MKLGDFLDSLLLFCCYLAIIVAIGYTSVWVYASMITFALRLGE